MSDDRRMTTDRFYGGVHGRLQNLHGMLSYIDDANPPEDDLVEWIIANTPAGSENAVKKHLGFIEGIDLIHHERGVYLLDDYGHKYHENPEATILYDALTSGVKGFQTLLRELDNGPMTVDNGMLTVDSETLEISHQYESDLTRKTVTIKRRHEIGVEFLAYRPC